MSLQSLSDLIFQPELDISELEIYLPKGEDLDDGICGDLEIDSGFIDDYEDSSSDEGSLGSPLSPCSPFATVPDLFSSGSFRNPGNDPDRDNDTGEGTTNHVL